ncbi:MAG: helix-turn-helix transcriptional regulator [Lachnospiraceae bacterium]|nr:helix-turn-helix transcriptional regulator [Lachnospiraceae bacterium]
MDEQFIRNRITKLRTQKGISEYKMSLDLGHSRSYMQGISSGRILPSLSEFLYICDYFGITPRDFFDDSIEDPVLLQTVYEKIKELEEDDLIAILGLLNRMTR